MKYFVLVILAYLHYANCAETKDFYADSNQPNLQEDLAYNSPKSSKRSIFNKSKNSTPDFASMAVASIREAPSEIHRCSAIFISNTALLTTASCIFGHQAERTTVHAKSEFLADTGSIFAVIALITHPYFEASPHVNDIGIVFIEGYVTDVPIFAIPSTELTARAVDRPVTIYSWKFSGDQKLYYLHYKQAFIVSGAKCSLILREYIDCDTICASDNTGTGISMGDFDQGAPLSFKYDGLLYAVGFYNREGLKRSVAAEKYAKTSVYREWIIDVLNNVVNGTGTKERNVQPPPKKV